MRRGLLECPLCLRAGLVGQLEEAWPYLWRVHARLPERYHQRCRVITRGKRNSALVQFEDGACYITSRNYLRKP